MKRAPHPSDSLLDLIGGTPLVPLHFAEEGLTVLGKAEFLNPSGSVKDRLAKAVILAGEASGELRPDSVIVECTSGNTGISLAMVGAARGYRVRTVMSTTARVPAWTPGSRERDAAGGGWRRWGCRRSSWTGFC